MECLWRLFCHWRPYGNSDQPHPAVFYLYFITDDGISYYYLPDPCFLEKYKKVRKSGEEKSLVLFVKPPEPYPDLSLKGKATNTQPLLIDVSYVFRIFFIIVSF